MTRTRILRSARRAVTVLAIAGAAATVSTGVAFAKNGDRAPSPAPAPAPTSPAPAPAEPVWVDCSGIAVPEGSFVAAVGDAGCVVVHQLLPSRDFQVDAVYPNVGWTGSITRATGSNVQARFLKTGTRVRADLTIEDGRFTYDLR